MASIGIYGDSYADYAPKKLVNKDKGLVPWMDVVNQLSNYEITNYASSSTSLWFSFNRFIKTYKKHDIIIFSYTHYLRWNGIKDEYAGLSQLSLNPTAKIPESLKDVAKTIIDAKEYLHNDELNLYVYQKIFDDINSICKDSSKKIINLFPFELSQGDLRITDDVSYSSEGHVIDLSKRNGPCILNLFAVSQLEEKEFSKIIHPIPAPDPRFCHLNAYNNNVYANIVFENLVNYSRDIFDVSKDPRFRYTVEDFEYIKEVL
jgi:hypothetical protein